VFLMLSSTQAMGCQEARNGEGGERWFILRNLMRHDIAMSRKIN